jgi:N-acetylneuraminic acid mutarotase
MDASCCVTIIFGLGLSFHVAQAAPSVFPYLDAMNHGYNVIKGAPLTGGRDPGWTTDSIFDVSCPGCFSEGSQFEAWSIPDDVAVQKGQSCSYDPSIFSVSSSSSFQRESERRIHFHHTIGHIPILKKIYFSGSADFRMISERSKLRREVHVYATAECQGYTMKRPLTPAHNTLSDNFVQAVKELPLQFSLKDIPIFLQFVERFGTHFASEVNIGASATAYNRFDELVYRNSIDLYAKLHVEGHTGFHWLFLASLGIKIPAGIHVDLKALNTLAMSISQNYTRCSPYCLPQTGAELQNASSAWRASLLANANNVSEGVYPQPVSSKMVSILQLFFSSDSNLGQLTGSDVPAQGAALEEFMKDHYCGLVDGCGTGRRAPTWVSDQPNLRYKRAGLATVFAQGSIFAIGGKGPYQTNISLTPAAEFGNCTESSKRLADISTNPFHTCAGGPLKCCPRCQNLPRCKSMHCWKGSCHFLSNADGIENATVGRWFYGHTPPPPPPPGPPVPQALLEVLDLGQHASPQWESGAQMKEARVYATATYLNDTGSIVVAGGQGTDSSPLNSIEILSLADYTWAAASPMHQSRMEHAAVAVNPSSLIVIGGRGSQSSPPTLEASSDSKQLRNQNQSQCSSPATKRLANKGTYAFYTCKGGPVKCCPICQNNANCQSMHCFDHKCLFFDRADGTGPYTVGSWWHGKTPTPPPPPFGSMDLKSVEQYNANTDKWTTLPSMRIARSGATADVHNGEVFVIGGFANNQAIEIGSMEIFSLATSQWRMGVPMLSELARGGHSSFIDTINANLIVLGGAARRDGEARQDTYVYELSNRLWTLPSLYLPWNTSSASVVAVPPTDNTTRAFLIGGQTDGNAMGNVSVCWNGSDVPDPVSGFESPSIDTEYSDLPSSDEREERHESVMPRSVLSHGAEAYADEPLPLMPGIFNLGKGLDVLRSEPFGTEAGSKSDPGLTNAVFQMGRPTTNRTWEEKWLIPDGVGARADQRCSLETTVDVIRDTFDLTSHYNEKRVITVCVLFFCFKFTKTWKEVEDAAQSSKMVFTKARASCNAYTASLDPAQAKLRPEFVAAVTKLPDKYDPQSTEALKDFVNNYGSHYVSKVNLGATAVGTSVFTQMKFSEMRHAHGSRGITIAAAMAFMHEVGLFIDKVQEGYDAFEYFIGNRDSHHMTWVPEAPPKPTTNMTKSAMDWLAQVGNNPDIAVIGKEFQNITDLFTTELIPGVATISQKRAVLQNYLLSGQYCHDMMGSKCTMGTRVDRWSLEKESAPRERFHTGSGLLNGNTIVIPGFDAPPPPPPPPPPPGPSTCTPGPPKVRLAGINDNPYTMCRYKVEKCCEQCLKDPKCQSMHCYGKPPTHFCAFFKTGNGTSESFKGHWFKGNNPLPPAPLPSQGGQIHTMAYNTDTRKWSLWPIPAKLSQPSSKVGTGVLSFQSQQGSHPDSLMMIGGSHDGTTANANVQLLKTSRDWYQCPSLQHPRSDAAVSTLAVTSSGTTVLRAYVFGGRTALRSASSAPLSQVEWIALNGSDAIDCTNSNNDLASAAGQWNADTPMPTARFGAAAATVDGAIYVVGGVSLTGVSSNVEVYTAGGGSSAGSWKSLQPMPAAYLPRGGHHLVAAFGNLYLIGGFSDENWRQPVSRVVGFNVGKNLWFDSADPSDLKSLDAQHAGQGLSIATAVPAVDEMGINMMQVHTFGGTSVGGAQSQSHAVLNLYDPTAARQAPTSAEFAVPTLQTKLSHIGMTSAHSVDAIHTVADSSGPVLPGVDFLGYGYDILKANPLASVSNTAGLFGPDGWSGEPVFDPSCPTCFTKTKSIFGKYRVPDSVSINVLQSCSLMTDNVLVTDRAELQQYFDQFVKVGAKLSVGPLGLLLSARFTAHERATEAFDALLEGDGALVFGTTTCEAYSISSTPESRKLEMWPSYQSAVDSLPDTFDQADEQLWLDFVSKYGTHIPTKVTMGGRAVQIRAVAGTKAAEQLGIDVSASFGLKVHALLGLFSMGIQFHLHEGANQHFNAKAGITANYTRCMPTCPKTLEISKLAEYGQHYVNGTVDPTAMSYLASARDAEDWAKALFPEAGGTPAPIHKELMWMTDFIREQTGNSTKADALEKFLFYHYCKLIPFCKPPTAGLSSTQVVGSAASSGGPRVGAAIGAVDGAVWFAGGASLPSTAAVSSETTVFSTNRSAWTAWSSAEPIPQAHFAPATAVANGILYVVGGLKNSPKTITPTYVRDDPSLEMTASFTAFDTGSKVWQTLKDMPRPRAECSAAFVDGSIWVIGGLEQVSAGLEHNQTMQPQCSDTQCRLPNDSCPAGTQGVACTGLCPAKCGGGVTGCGCAGAPGPTPGPSPPWVAASTVFKYSIEAGTWEEISGKISVPVAAASAVIGSDILLFGGMDTGNDWEPTTEINVYQTTSMRLASTQATLPYATSHAGCVPLSSSTVFLAGGFVKEKQQQSATDYTAMFNAANLTWVETDRLSVPMAPATAAVMYNSDGSHGTLGDGRKVVFVSDGSTAPLLYYVPDSTTGSDDR